jgi:predicted amidohydrolase
LGDADAGTGVREPGFLRGREQDGRFWVKQFLRKSVVYDPWGETLCRLGEEEGVGFCEIDLPLVDAVREKLPCFPMRRPDLY